MPGGKLSHKKPSPKAQDFADKQSLNKDTGTTRRQSKSPAHEPGQGMQDRGPTGQFTGPGAPGLTKK